MGDVLEVAISMLLGTLGPILLVAWDERRLAPDAQARAWPISTRLAASLAFGPLCLPVHFFRTRRTFVGTLLGFGVMLALLALIVGLSSVVHWIAD